MAELGDDLDQQLALGLLDSIAKARHVIARNDRNQSLRDDRSGVVFSVDEMQRRR